MNELLNNLDAVLESECYCRYNGECTKNDCRDCGDYAISYKDIKRILEEKQNER